MKIELIIQSINTGKLHDVSNAVTDLEYSSSMYDQPGKLTFKILDDTIYASGGIVRLKVDGKGIFFGKIFTTEITEDSYTVTAYDQMRYLQNKDTVPYKDKTIGDIFVDVCKRMNLKYKVNNESTYKLPLKLYENKSYWEMLTDSAEQTFMAIGEQYIVRDDFGTLELINVGGQKTDLIVGSKSLMTGFTYKKDIDEDTFNRIKLFRSNKDTGSVDSWVVENTDTQAKWGVLQYTKSVDEKMNIAQIKEFAKLLLKVKNRELKTLSFSCIGDPIIKAGTGVKIEIDGILDEWVICNSVTHKFEDGIDMMNIEVSM